MSCVILDRAIKVTRGRTSVIYSASNPKVSTCLNFLSFGNKEWFMHNSNVLYFNYTNYREKACYKWYLMTLNLTYIKDIDYEVSHK